MNKSDLKVLIAFNEKTSFNTLLEISRFTGLHRHTVKKSIERLTNNKTILFSEKGFQKTNLPKFSLNTPPEKDKIEANQQNKNNSEHIHNNESYPQTYPQEEFLKNLFTKLYMGYPQTYPQAFFKDFPKKEIPCNLLTFFVHFSQLAFARLYGKSTENDIYNSARARRVINNILFFNVYCYSKKWPKLTSFFEALGIDQKQQDFFKNLEETDFESCEGIRNIHNSHLNDHRGVLIENTTNSSTSNVLRAVDSIQKGKDLTKKQNKKSNLSVLSENEEYLFKLFWDAYPLKVRKDLAKKEFSFVIKRTNIYFLLKALENQKFERSFAKSNGSWCPQLVRAHRWLGEKRFL